MTKCEHYGIAGKCGKDCPALAEGECYNEEMCAEYERFLQEQSSNFDYRNAEFHLRKFIGHKLYIICGDDNIFYKKNHLLEWVPYKDQPTIGFLCNSCHIAGNWSMFKFRKEIICPKCAWERWRDHELGKIIPTIITIKLNKRKY
jgi:hypothetical protein